MTWRPCHACGEATRIGRRFSRNGFTIVGCEVCGLVYCQEIPSPAELERLYGETFFRVGHKFEEAADQGPGVGVINARHRIARLLTLPGLGRRRWLDVGAATGDFLVAAREAGVTGPRGIELSAFAVDVARTRGLDVVQGDFASADVEAGSYDLVTMWDYIEHVPDPVASLGRAFDAVAHGGYLAISTGDAASLVARLTGRFWHLMIPPKHLYFFTPDSLARVLGTAGFHMAALERPGKRVPLDFAAWKAASIVSPRLSAPVLRAASRLGLGQVQPVVNLRDIMTVYARKP
ncbi:MAG TPA: class I SAM-dependent methyltransferase [Vicinamibacterales bacterium]|nr:class I SAM-dependent methyltransferase [Vicinamibacterales bacterium]